MLCFSELFSLFHSSIRVIKLDLSKLVVILKPCSLFSYRVLFRLNVFRIVLEEFVEITMLGSTLPNGQISS